MSQSVALTPLAEGFAPPTPEAWRALVEKTLKGAGADSLLARIEGVDIAPLYTAAETPSASPISRRAHEAGRPFDLRAPIRAADANGARAAIQEALENGAASVLIDLSTSADGPAGLADMLDGVLTDVAPIALHAGARGAEAAERLSAAVKASPAAPLALHLDPIGAGLDGSTLANWAATAARLSVTHPRASLFLADGAALHDRGAAPAFELAHALASALAYVKALVEAGLPMEDAFSRIVLALAVDQKPLIGIAKLRAGRRLWARMSDACGVSEPAAIEARSSHRMLTIADPWSNLVRLTIAAFAGAVGGADALMLYPHDAAEGAVHPLGARFARNTGLVLMEESALGRVFDPAAGAFALESLTDELSMAAWNVFQEIERAGGIQTAINNGMASERLESDVAALRADLKSKRLRIVGVTDYRAADAGQGSAPAASGLRLETLA